MNWWQRILQELFKRRPSPVPPVIPPPVVPSGWQAELLRLHNAERAVEGRGKLAIESRLATAAHKHAEWMKANRKMSHDGAAGSSAGDRIDGTGYRPSIYGENIARGYQSPRDVVEGWMQSPGHRANILGAQYTEIGFGWAGDYWCVVFARPAGSRGVSKMHAVHDSLPPGLEAP